MKHVSFFAYVAVIGLVFLLTLNSPGMSSPSVTIEKTFLSVQPEDSMAYAESAVISPDSTRLAYVAASDQGMRVMTDDRAGNLYDHIAQGFPIFSPQKNRVGYIATLAGRNIVVVDETEHPGFDGACCLTFSPDGKSFAYIAQKEGKQVVVFNGTPHKPFDAIDRQIGLVFGPGSSRLAYAALVQDRVALVIDGKPQERTWDIIEEIAFSPDAKSIACITKAQKKYFVLQDSILQGPFDLAEALTWSPDSKSLVFVAIKNDNWITVKNGKAIPSGKYVVQTVFNPGKKEYEYMVPQITPPVFSPDGSRFAFTRADGFRYRVCVKDQQGPLFDSVGAPTFSPDSRHYAYIGILAQKAVDKYSLVYDGNIIAAYDLVVPPIVFSPDSKRIGFRAGTPEKKFMVIVDGEEGHLYDNVSRPFFSPNSQRIAYKALKNGKTMMIVDGKEHQLYVDTTRPFFSPDSSLVAYLSMEQSLSSFLIIDGEKVLPFTSYIPDTESAVHTPIVFKPDNGLHFIGFFLEGDRFHGYRVDAGTVPPPGGKP